MARELLRYRSTDDFYEEWLDRIAELVNAAGEAPAPSRSLPPPPPQAGDPVRGAPLPPLRRDVVPEPRREAPQRGPPRRALAHDEESCRVVPRPQGEARALPAPLRQGRAPPPDAAQEHQDQDPPQQQKAGGTAGCRAFTPELRRVVWPGKFKPDRPPRYDGTPDPAEFLQLYELSIEAASSDEKVMANWFPMALKDGARSWLLNLPAGSISSWDEMRERFIANFQGTRDRAPAVGDLRRVEQQPGETLHKCIQRFTNVRLKIPKVMEEAIISAFTDGVQDVKMKEEIAMHEDLCSALEMFNMAARCTRAEEGRLTLLELPEADPEDKKAKAKDVKRKGPAVLTAELEMKRGCDYPESSKGSRPFSVFHNVHSHNTNDCQELRAIRDGHLGRPPERNDHGYGHGGGRGGGRWDNRDPRQDWRDQPHEDRW
jgi:hypothetical protein